MSSTSIVSIQTPGLSPPSEFEPHYGQTDIELNPLPRHVAQYESDGRILGTEVSDDAPDSSTEQLQTMSNPYHNRFRVLSSCLMGFANGMNDSAPGALIASLERDYNIKYGTVSIIFLCVALGFYVAAFFLNTLSLRIGRAKCLILSEISLMIGYGILVSTPPFPVVAAAFFMLGIGMAMNLAICQVYCANLANNTLTVSLYQSSYGIGGVLGPLLATALVSQGSPWSRFYIVELGLATMNLIFAPWAFWNVDKDHQLHQPGTLSASPPAASGLRKKWQSFKTLITDRPTIVGSFFAFAYQGAEVAISGWVISFLIQIRHGDPSKVGFVTSGFWGGIVLGRLTLSFLAHEVGERRFVFVVTIGALIVELLIWFVPSITGDSVAVAVSGLLLGPIHPCMIHLLQKLIPKKMQISSLSLLGCIGTSGGAIAPFMTGMLAQTQGTYVLHPICMGLFVMMGGLWWSLPEVEKREE